MRKPLYWLENSSKWGPVGMLAPDVCRRCQQPTSWDLVSVANNLLWAAIEPCMCRCTGPAGSLEWLQAQLPSLWATTAAGKSAASQAAQPMSFGFYNDNVLKMHAEVGPPQLCRDKMVTWLLGPHNKHTGCALQ